MVVVLTFIALARSSGLSSLAQNSGSPVEIWFEPLTWNIKPSGQGLEYTKHDFTELLKPDAPWQTAASRISVLGLQQNVVWSYPNLQAIIAMINSHHLKLAFSSGMLFTTEACGKGIEGISRDPDGNRETITIARKWKEAGGRLDYIIMDGPYYFGHHYAGSCHYPIAEVARRAAATLQGVRAYFPDVEIIDAEGPGDMADDVWLAEMAEWFDEFRGATGRPIGSVALDLHWIDLRPGNDWRITSVRAANEFHRRGLRTGLIINTENRRGLTDADWMDENRLHIQEAAKNKLLALDFILLSQWHDHVQMNLPEYERSAYTSLINAAFAAFNETR